MAECPEAEVEGITFLFGKCEPRNDTSANSGHKDKHVRKELLEKIMYNLERRKHEQWLSAPSNYQYKAQIHPSDYLNRKVTTPLSSQNSVPYAVYGNPLQSASLHGRNIDHFTVSGEKMRNFSSSTWNHNSTRNPYQMEAPPRMVNDSNYGSNHAQSGFLARSNHYPHGEIETPYLKNQLPTSGTIHDPFQHDTSEYDTVISSSESMYAGNRFQEDLQTVQTKNQFIQSIDKFQMQRYNNTIPYSRNPHYSFPQQQQPPPAPQPQLSNKVPPYYSMKPHNIQPQSHLPRPFLREEYSADFSSFSSHSSPLEQLNVNNNHPSSFRGQQFHCADKEDFNITYSQNQFRNGNY